MAENSFIQIQELSKSYQEGDRKRTVLHNTNLEIAAGEFIAILGKSGSGKSTFLNLISGIDRCDQGKIVIHSQNLTAMDEHQRTLFRRKHIGFIFQFYNLIPTLTVWENVVLPLELNGMSNGSTSKRAGELLENVELLDRRGAFPDRLSGGEQQRVAIARALVNDPLLVLADEPTGNLDHRTAEQVMDLLERLHRVHGLTSVLATHNMELAQRAARTLRLEDGQLTEVVVPRFN